MSLRTRVMRLESRCEPDDLIAALQAWVKSLSVDDVRCLAAFTETAEPFPEERYRMTKREAQERAWCLLDEAPEDIRRAYLPMEANRPINDGEGDGREP